MPTDVSRENVIKIYDRWAPVYDKVFGSIFEQARRAAIAASEAVGGRVLEVGVGTGISLPYYSTRCSVIGIDISEAMLDVARARVARQGLRWVEDLRVMDAQNLDFADGTFDVVTAQYVVNTVPDPEEALAEFVRVLKPGGELIVINRVGAERGVRLEGRASPAAPCSAPRLAIRVSVAPLRDLAGASSGHGSTGAAPDAAIRAFRAHTLRQAP